MIFYTADMHFGNESIIAKTDRPFATVEEMDEQLIANWNAVVSPEDTVYILGDVGLNHGPIPAEYVARLNGHKHLIRGNHDTGLDRQEEWFDYVESVTDFLEIDDGEIHVTLCHYPIVYIQRGYMIHGHLHNTRKDTYEIMKQLHRVLNAGVDINHFRPVTLQELIENNREFYEDPERGLLNYLHSGKFRMPPGWKADFRPLPLRPMDRDA